MRTGRIAEVQDVRFHSLDEIKRGGAAFCRIKGLLFHSAMVVDRVEVLPAENAMWLIVAMGLTRPGASGAFEVDVPLSGDIKSVVFGTDHTPIWRRTAGKRQQEAAV